MFVEKTISHCKVGGEGKIVFKLMVWSNKFSYSNVDLTITPLKYDHFN